MKGYDDTCPQLLDLIPNEREWVSKRAEQTSHGLSEEKKLELSLGPPGGENTTATSRERNHHDSSHLPFGYFTTTTSPRLQNLKSPWQHQTRAPSFLHLHSQATVIKESSQPCSNRAAELQSAEKKAFSPANTAGVPNSQKRCLRFYYYYFFFFSFHFDKRIFTAFLQQFVTIYVVVLALSLCLVFLFFSSYLFVPWISIYSYLCFVKAMS